MATVLLGSTARPAGPGPPLVHLAGGISTFELFQPGAPGMALTDFYLFGHALLNFSFSLSPYRSHLLGYCAGLHMACRPSVSTTADLKWRQHRTQKDKL